MDKTYRKKGFVIVTGLIIAVFLLLHLGLSNVKSQRQEKASTLEASLQSKQEENTELKDELEYIGTDDYIISTAREDYNYVNKDDIRFTYTNPEVLYKYTEEQWQRLMDELAD